MAKRRNFASRVSIRAGERNPRRERKQIVAAVAEMARELGRTPSLAEFGARAQISIRRLKRTFVTWNQALITAGLEPKRLYKRPSENELLTSWGEAVRRKGGAPRRYWYLMHGKNSPETLEKRFGGWQAVPAAFLKFAERKPEWNDVAVLLEREIRAGNCSSAIQLETPASPPRRRSALFKGSGPRGDALTPARRGEEVGTCRGPRPGADALSSSSHGADAAQRTDRPCARTKVRANRDRAKACTRTKVRANAPHAGRAICGNPMSFRGMRYEPVNEQGVVLLFGMMAEELGYTVESAQTAFPDCEAKRCVGPDMWQHVRIEVEFESRNFLTHGHPLRGCDVIVCWRHNWNDCPEAIEVVELAEMLRR